MFVVPLCLLPPNADGFFHSFQLFSWNNDIFLLKKFWFEKCSAGQTLIAFLGVVNDLGESHTFLCGVPRIIINNFVTYNDFLIASLLERKALTLNTGYLRSLFIRIQHQIKCLLPWKRFLAMGSYGHVLCWFSFALLFLLFWVDQWMEPVNHCWLADFSAFTECPNFLLLWAVQSWESYIFHLSDVKYRGTLEWFPGGVSAPLK